MRRLILILFWGIIMYSSCGFSSKRIPNSDYVYTLNNDSSDSLRRDSIIYKNADTKQEHDNLRGFDPISEDDMDDNGMIRYMENTDEEGWD